MLQKYIYDLDRKKKEHKSETRLEKSLHKRRHVLPLSSESEMPGGQDI
jgi:hypothetical protein